MAHGRAHLVESTLDAVADADGRAVVRFQGPVVVQDVINVDAISLRSDSEALPDATLYRGAPAVGRRIAHVADGKTGGFFRTGASDVIHGGDVWTVEWTGADPGSTCSAALTGTVTTRGTATV